MISVLRSSFLLPPAPTARDVSPDTAACPSVVRVASAVRASGAWRRKVRIPPITEAGSMTAVDAFEGGVAVPEPGRLVRVRGRHWVVADVNRGGLGDVPQHFVSLSSVEDDR